MVGTALVLWRILRAPGRPAAERARSTRWPLTRRPVDRRRRDLARLAGRARGTCSSSAAGSSASGALLDAASRGLRAALVEQDDIASGTSSRSSRLIHGGLRYLEQFQFGLVGEALAERARLLRLAPHLVRLEEFLFPLYGLPVVTPRLLRRRHDCCTTCWARRSRAGCTGTLDAGHARVRAGPAPRGPARRARLPRRDGGRRPLHARGRCGRRSTAARARRDPGPGDRAAPRRRTGSSGRAPGTAMTGAELEIRARPRVLDATGVWASRPGPAVRRGVVQRRAVARQPHPRPARAAPGPRRDDAARPGPGRVPRPVAAPLDHRHDRRAVPRARSTARRPARDDVDELLGTVNGALDVDLSRDDVVGTYAGLRPLIAPVGPGSTVKVSRASTGSRASPTASSGSAAASTRPTG